MATRDYVLGVGDSVRLSGGFVWLNATELIYAGMPTPQTFSLGISRTQVYNSWSTNLYYPNDRVELVLGGSAVEVMAVNPREIRLRITG